MHDRRHSIKPKQTIYLDCNVFLYHPERMEEGPKRKEKKVEQHQSAKNPEQMGIADSLLHEKLIDTSKHTRRLLFFVINLTLLGDEGKKEDCFFVT